MDWADEKAWEWLINADIDPHSRLRIGLAYGEELGRHLATLLREVSEMEVGPYIGFKEHMKDKALDRAALLAEVRRVVEDECPPIEDIRDEYEQGANKTCRAILRRLEEMK